MSGKREKAPRDSVGPSGRVVDVMNFLASHPTETFSLSEIARHFDMSNGTAHRLLTKLAEARYLSRHPRHKTYSLGMALVAIGKAALAKHRDIEIAQRELVRLAGELKVQCVVSTVADGELLILACEGSSQGREPPNQIGERRPLIPPLGIGHFAWADERAQADFLLRAPVAFSAAARERMAFALSVIRKRGYNIAASGPAIRALRQLTSLPLGDQASEALWAGLRQLLADLSPDEIQLLDLDDIGPEGVSYITAPIFSPSGEVVLELGISGLPHGLDSAGIAHCVERLCAAAAIVTAETHGRSPLQPATTARGRRDQDEGGSRRPAKRAAAPRSRKAAT